MEPRTILLVEDNQDDVALTKRALRKNQFAHNLVVAADGVEALDYLLGCGKYHGRNLDDMPQCILLDLKLPHLNGLETLRYIRTNQRTRYLPVVVLTSSLEEQDIASSYDYGANSYIRKPVDFLDFIEVMKHLGAYWLHYNELPPREGEFA